MTITSELRERCEAAGQGHLFRFWERLGKEERSRLLAQVEALDFELLEEMRSCLRSPEPPERAPAFEPPVLFPLERDAEQERRAAEARERGADTLRAGRAGFVLVAGGQGSRLGFEGPKGKYPIGPVTGRTLFGWLAARIAAARERHGAVAPWYVMTSATNDAETRAYFEENDHFGLGAENVRFFRQRMLPALDPQGRIVLRTPSELFRAPNGHGGTLEALASSGCLADAAERGVDQLSYFQVDSPLARPADTLFLGLHELAGADMSSKVVAKRAPEEKVGVLGRADGQLGCIEYSDLPDDLRHARDPDGELTFRAGNIANHLLRRRFVERLTEGGLRLPWHLARKQVDSVDENGDPVRIEGVKFETFVFDALGEADGSVTLEVDRRLQFSPVKNAEGDASPATCRATLGGIFAEWVAAAGGPPPPRDGEGTPLVEVDPRFAEDRESFVARAPVTPRVVGDGHLYE